MNHSATKVVTHDGTAPDCHASALVAGAVAGSTFPSTHVEHADARRFGPALVTSSARLRPSGLLLALPFALAAVVVLEAWPSARPAAAARPAASAPHVARDDDAQRLYLSDCAVCHGADGRGTNRGPTLVGVGRASLDYWLSTGRMPLVSEVGRDPRTRHEQPLPADQLGDPNAVPQRHHPAYPREIITALTDYVSGITGGDGPDIPQIDPTSGNLAEGGRLFQLQCAACHAWAGDGGALLHREAPALHQATPTQIAEAVRIGPDVMPAFGTAALSDDQLASVVRYVRYLDDPRDRGGLSIWHLGPAGEGAVVWVFGIGAVVLAIRWMGSED